MIFWILKVINKLVIWTYVSVMCKRFTGHKMTLPVLPILISATVTIQSLLSINAATSSSLHLCLGITSSPIIFTCYITNLHLNCTSLNLIGPLSSLTSNVFLMPHIPKTFSNFVNRTFSFPQKFFSTFAASLSQTFPLALFKCRPYNKQFSVNTSVTWLS